MTRKWYVLRTRPRSEALATAALEKESFDVFAPRVQTLHRRSRFVDAPLFPGYIFLRFDMDTQDMESVCQLPGVAGWVRFDGIVPCVPDEVIADLAERVERIEEAGGLWRRFMPGDKVRVVSEQMECLGRVVQEARSPKARVRVLLEFMGRMVSAQVPRHSLQPVGGNIEPEKGRKGQRRTRGRGRWINGFGPRAAARAYH